MNPQNEQIVSSLKENFQAAGASFLVDYHGCTCEELTAFRKNLRTSGARFAIIKNTFTKLAIDGTELAGLSEFLSGPTAVVWSDHDPVAPAKAIADFSKKQEKFTVKAGFVEGAVVNVEQVKALASLPSKEELYAKLLSLINAPATRLLQTVNAPAATLVRLLAAVRDKKQGEN